MGTIVGHQEVLTQLVFIVCTSSTLHWPDSTREFWYEYTHRSMIDETGDILCCEVPNLAIPKQWNVQCCDQHGNDIDCPSDAARICTER